MKLIGLLAIIMLIIISIRYVNYKRQIKNIIIQLNERYQDDSRKLLTTDISDATICELIDIIEKIYFNDKSNLIEKEKNQQEFKNSLTDLSHDMRTPLTAIKGYLDLLYEDNDIERKEKYLNIIKTRVKGLERLVDDLFYSFKIENNIEPEENEIDIAKILLEILFSYYQSYEDKNIETKIQIPETCIINSNADILKRVFDNLSKNICEHGSGYAEITMEDIEDDIKIKFKNGIEKEIVNPEKIFQRFYTIDDSRSKSSSGIGLHIVKMGIEKLNGDIKLNSNSESIEFIICLKK
ncbi:MAG: HAMP domain-containing sensor histidine kinase [Tissierellia bacterium]|nr:HAMP domain-containing sensor histidine kinase [Tissierellia bacterium]